MYDFNRLAQVNLIKGPGTGRPEDGLCLLQLVDWFDGHDNVCEYPECVSPAIAAFGRWLNDWCDDVRRQELKPFVPLLVGTADPAAEDARARHLLNWIICRGLEDDGAAEEITKNDSHDKLWFVMRGLTAWTGCLAEAAGCLAQGAPQDINFDRVLWLPPTDDLNAAFEELAALIRLGAHGALDVDYAQLRTDELFERLGVDPLFDGPAALGARLN